MKVTGTEHRAVEPGNPPAGNGLFDQLDIVAALGTRHYLTGPYAAVRSGGNNTMAKRRIVYDPAQRRNCRRCAGGR